MYRIGIDLGGTHIGAGLVENGVLKAKNMWILRPTVNFMLR